jgi:hypothetical protein
MDSPMGAMDNTGGTTTTRYDPEVFFNLR